MKGRQAAFCFVAAALFTIALGATIHRHGVGARSLVAAAGALFMLSLGLKARREEEQGER